MTATSPARPLTEDLTWLLARASWALQSEMAAGLEGLGVSPRAQCLLSTAMGGQYTQSELAKLVGLDKTTMVVTVDELEQKGLAERVLSPTDRRARIIAVTEAGRRKVAEGRAVTERIRDDVLDALEPEEREVFLGALAKLVTERLAEPAQCSGAPRRRAPKPPGQNDP